MAQTKSTLISNLVNIPRVVNAKALVDKEVRVAMDKVTVPVSSSTDTIILGRIPVDAILLSVELSSANLSTGSIVDLGLFKRGTGADPSAFVAVSDNCIADSLDLSQAQSMALTEQRFNGESADDFQKKAWEIAGLSSKPTYDHLYFGLTVDTGTTTAGIVAITALFTI